MPFAQLHLRYTKIRSLRYLYKIFELVSYLNKKTKRKFIFIFLVSIVNSLFEFMTIGVMVPFISFVSNRDAISEIEILRRTAEFFNFKETKELFLFVSFSFLIIIFLSGFIKIFAIKIINDFSGTLKIELGKKLYKGILYREYEYHLNTNSSQLISSQIQQLESCLVVISQFQLFILSLGF